MMKHILFVDDEQRILDGLKRTLRSMRDEWNMLFACGGEEALRILEQSPIDIIISDMRMPGMDGAQLLREVQQRYPHVVRVILSGQSDKEMVLQSISATHLFLSKPCEAKVLQATIQRVCVLPGALKNDSLRAVVGRMQTIPSMPRLYAEIKSLVESDNWSLRAVSDIVAQDPGMTAKVLQLVNSAYFGLATNVSTVEEAVNFLGVDIVQSLMLTADVFTQFPGEQVSAFHIDALWSKGMMTGMLARAIAKAERRPRMEVEQAFIGGLLHDIGILMLVAGCGEPYRSILETALAQKTKLWEIEQSEFGVTHAEVGAYLLALWGIGPSIVEAVSLHHCPGEFPINDFSPVTAVHVAEVLHQEIAGPAIECLSSSLDLPYLERLKLADRVPYWRSLAENTRQESA